MSYTDKVITQLPFILFALAVTLFVETIIYYLVIDRTKKLLVTISVMNILFNLSMNLLLMLAPNVDIYYLMLLIFEVVTLLAEALVLTLVLKLSYKKALSFSFVANFLSFVFGTSFYSLGFIDEIKGPSWWTLVLSYIIVISLYGLLFLFTHHNNNDNNNRDENNKEQTDEADDEEVNERTNNS